MNSFEISIMENIGPDEPVISVALFRNDLDSGSGFSQP